MKVTTQRANNGTLVRIDSHGKLAYTYFTYGKVTRKQAQENLANANKLYRTPSLPFTGGFVV